MLAGNQLSTLPGSIGNCKSLELLRISANQFTELPSWLLSLPKLKWLAYAGNPFSNVVEAERMQEQRPIAIDWAELTIGKVLGQGASGVTYQTNWQHNSNNEAVAVKLFKGGLTSDGLPSCEMHANVIAGEHKNLVGVIGVIANHPEGVQGLVMPLLSAGLKILAEPPSFETCTRDVYPVLTTLSSAQALHITNGVGNALHHLHAKGLMHGDLYAHNILWNGEQVVLSDLGAASFLPIQNEVMARLLAKLDVRAYQVLVEELASFVGLTDL